MRRNKFKLTAWCCGILSAAINLQSAGAAPAEESPKPNVKETSKQLEGLSNCSSKAKIQPPKRAHKKPKNLTKKPKPPRQKPNIKAGICRWHNDLGNNK